jgi:hypothetical protein
VNGFIGAKDLRVERRSEFTQRLGVSRLKRGRSPLLCPALASASVNWVRFEGVILRPGVFQRLLFNSLGHP